jgi:hypothetical protein
MVKAEIVVKLNARDLAGRNTALNWRLLQITCNARNCGKRATF